MAQSVNDPPTMQETLLCLIPGSGRSPGEGIGYPLQCSWAPLVAQQVKNPPALGETWVRSLGWEDPLKKGKATYSSILAWRIPWTCLVHGVAASGLAEQLSLSPSLVAQSVKNPPTVRETWVRSLGWEDPLEVGMATHSSILAWRIYAQRSLAGCSP